MSKANGRLVCAVAYVRRSTEKQESSMKDQEVSVQKYADENGYKILRWYKDDAISGDSTEKRHAFLQMIADAEKLRDFEAILCWDGARFGRFDSIEAGYYIFPLRKAGVYLDTVVEGITNWNDSTGRIVGGVKQEGKHQQLIDLSANVTRGQLEAAQSGSWVGSPPYAYEIEGVKKQKRLVLGDAAKVRVVQRIYREFVEERRSMNNIADRLNAEGILSPSGMLYSTSARGWRYDAVKIILENPAYAGDYAGCRYSYGKYHTVKEGRVTKANGKRFSKLESDWIVRRDHHEAIIDRATFEKARAILKDTCKPGRSPHTPETNPYILTGILRCGICGCPLWGEKNRKYRYYECSHRKYNGKAACEGTTIREDIILNSLANHLETWLGLDMEALGMAAHYDALTAEDLPEAFAEIKKLVTPPARPKQNRERLEKQAVQLKAKLAKARENLILLDAPNIPAAQEVIRKLDDELAKVERELKECKPPAAKDVNAVVLEVLNNLYSLANCCKALARPAEEGWVRVGSLQSAAPQAIRRLLTHASHIECHTKKVGEGTGTRHVFDRGEIVFNGVGSVTGNPNPDLAP